MGSVCLGFGSVIVGVAAPALASTPSISATPSSFGSGQNVVVSGDGFAPNVSVSVWFDGNGNGSLDSGEPSTSMTTTGSGSFVAPSITVLASPGQWTIRAEDVSANIASTQISVGSCWIQDLGCTINGAQWICIVGDSPSELISDCKSIDSNYSDPVAYPNGLDLSNIGPRFLGAGVLAAAAVDVNPVPGSGCAAMVAAIAIASNPPFNNIVPDQFYALSPTHGLLSIACGVPLLAVPPLDLGLYGAAATVEALLPGNHGLPDDALTDASVIAAVVLAVKASALVLGPAILVAAQQTLAAAAVAGAIACGFVQYYCNGSDITGNVLAHPDLQQRLIPFKLPFQRWGDLIGWAQVACVNNFRAFGGACTTPATLPLPGSAGVNNVAAPIRCTTGTVNGLSIGYDGDAGFDVNDSLVDPELGPGPLTELLTNYHNFEPGPGGSESPSGVDVEVPLSDRGLFATQLAELRVNDRVRVCGHWVADMHQFWNELHPMTSLVILESTPPIITPTVTGTLGTNGWYTSDVHVSWSVVDAESTISAQSGCDPTAITADTTAGGTTLMCSATSDGGTTTQTVTITKDATKPTILAAAITSPNGSGWYNSDVTVHFTCTDNLSGIPPAGCPADEVLGTEGAAVSSTSRTVTDAAGNVSDPSNVVTVKIDKTKPTIVAASTSAANGAGWYNSDVTVQFTCTDNLSGIPPAGCPADEVLGTEGATVSSTSQTVTDAADNVSNSSNVVTVRIDKTPPLVAVTGVTNGAQYVAGAVPAGGCHTTDAPPGSGVATVATLTVTPIGASGVGSFTAICAGAVDVAGNAQAAPSSASYTVVYGFGGFLAPLPKSTLSKSGSTIPVKFRLTNAAGQPISTSLAAALAAAAKVQVTLTGPAITTVSVLCTWDSTNLFFQCNIKTPNGLQVGPAYQITAYEKVGPTFVIVPSVGSAVNPGIVYFK